MQYSYREIKDKFDLFLIESPLTGETVKLYEAANYILRIGGKRIRPVMVLMAYNLYKKEVEDAMYAALAVELFHNFTLVHDDIMDKATLRRTHKTVHEKYGVNKAILCGDLMLIHVYELLQKYLGYEQFSELFNSLNQTGIQICQGQEMDMEFENRTDVSIEDYLKMVSYKTAVLLAYSLQCGALLGGASKKDSLHLYQFGLNLGIAFQLQDDILDVFGITESVGKIKGGDILQNKKTYLYLKALELGDKNQKERLINLYSIDKNRDKKIKEVTDIFKAVHVEEYSNQLQEAYQQLAFSHLDAIEMNVSGAELKKLCMQLLNRTS